MYAIPVFLLLVTVAGVIAVSVDLDESQEAAVQNVFKQMLKIHPPSNLTAVKSATPPRHMMELYEKLKTRGGGRTSATNTVRSILPMTGHRHSSELVVFNVTCIDQNEDVQLAELHINRRRFPRHRSSRSHMRRMLAPPYRVRLYQILHAHAGREKSGVGRARTKPLASIPIPHFTRGGWHAIDITAALRELLFNAQSPNVQLMLGIRFEAPKGKPVHPNHFLQHAVNVDNGTANSPAFLVVFSEDASDNDLPEDDSAELPPPTPPTHTHLMAELLQSAGKGILTDNSNVTTIAPSPTDTEPSNEINKTNEDFYIDESENDFNLRHKHKIKSLEYQLGKMEESNSIDVFNNHPSSFERRYLEIVRNQGSGDVVGKRRSSRKLDTNMPVESKMEEGKSEKRRIIRSIIDNELPDKDMFPSQTSPEIILKERASSDEIMDDKNTIPFPSYGRRWRSGLTGSGGGPKKRKGKGRRKDHQKRKNKPNDNSQLDKEGKEPSEGGVSTNSKGQSVTCKRQKLSVDFRIIGWDNWIIYPQAFEAYYCAGKCPFPLTKALKPTNHATIQSLMHATGLEPGVPAPCCVPDHLSSMSLMYVDDSSNVVLKTYPNMIVDSCACR